MSESTANLYDRASTDWQRTAPILLSDFTARPFLLDWCDPVDNINVLDIGCGEGYFARNLKNRGAGELHAMDISKEMVRHAHDREQVERLGIRYSTGTATDLGRFADDSFDLVVAVFLYNYLTKAETKQSMQEVTRVLRSGGRFIFAVPHPSLPFLTKRRAPFYFDQKDAGYFSGRDQQFEGEIWRRDGKSVPVRTVHKTLEDYFECLHATGLTLLPEIAELHVTEELLALDPKWFGPLVDKPLHLAFRVEVS